MANPTLTMAGLQATAGDARRAGSPACIASPLAAVPAALPITGGHGYLHTSSWAVDGVAEHTTCFMVFDAKPRPTRQPSELSP
jgi:hypothetical protein